MTLRFAVTMRITHETHYLEPRDSISHDMISYLTTRGVEPILIPNAIDDPVSIMESCSPHLLLITGGGGLEESLRMKKEEELLQHAVSSRTPVFGICRGIQRINFFFGGKISSVVGHTASTHKVHFSQEFNKIYGSSAETNSFHDFGIAPQDLGEDLKVFATDDEGWIEGLCHNSLPFAAVMWHPERPHAVDGDFELMKRLASTGGIK